MNIVIRKYLKILRVELEDLYEHIDELIAVNRERRAKKQETEHVCFENVAVLENEKCGLTEFLTVLDRIDPGAYADLDHLIDDLSRRFREKVTSCAIAQAAYLFALRKMRKVRAYVAPSGSVNRFSADDVTREGVPQRQPADH